MATLDFTTLTNALLDCVDVKSVTYFPHVGASATPGVRIQARFDYNAVERVVTANEAAAAADPVQFAQTLAGRLIEQVRQARRQPP